jgi:hypothetical protein
MTSRQFAVGSRQELMPLSLNVLRSAVGGGLLRTAYCLLPTGSEVAR